MLHFERLPRCLGVLPFVDAEDPAPLPFHPERGTRPPGDFFDFFPEEYGEEEVVWTYASEDFETFGYQRYDCGLPQDAPDGLWLT